MNEMCKLSSVISSAAQIDGSHEYYFVTLIFMNCCKAKKNFQTASNYSGVARPYFTYMPCLIICLNKKKCPSSSLTIFQEAITLVLLVF